MKMYRPIKFDFAKETDTKIGGGIDGVINEIKHIPTPPSSLTINDRHLSQTVSHADTGLVPFDSASENTVIP